MCLLLNEVTLKSMDPTPKVDILLSTTTLPQVLTQLISHTITQSIPYGPDEDKYNIDTTRSQHLKCMP